VSGALFDLKDRAAIVTGTSRGLCPFAPEIVVPFFESVRNRDAFYTMNAWLQ
jgi:hypothetical protein